MKKPFRFLAWLFAGLAAWRFYGDISRTLLQDRDFQMHSTGQIWAEFHRNSLLGLQPAVERYISPRLWENVCLPILETPLLLILIGLAIFFFIASAPRFKLR